MLLLGTTLLFGAVSAASKQCFGEALGCSKCETFAACAAYTDSVGGGGGNGFAMRDGIVVKREDAPDVTGFGTVIERSNPFEELVGTTNEFFASDDLTEDSVLRFHYEFEGTTLEINNDKTLLGALALAAQSESTLTIHAFTVTSAPTKMPTDGPSPMPTDQPTDQPSNMPTLEYYTVSAHDPSPGGSYGTSWKTVDSTVNNNLVWTPTGDGLTKVKFEFSIHGPNHGGVRLRDLNSGEIYGKEGTYGFDWLTTVNNGWEKRTIQRILPLTAGQTYNFVVEGRSNSGTIQFHGGNADQEYSGFWISFAPMHQNYVYKWTSGWDTYSAQWMAQITSKSMSLGANPKLLIALDYSVYGTAHGGIQWKMFSESDNALVATYGTQGTYGYDWIMPTTNDWEKRFDQFLWEPSVAEGRYYFQIWARAQGNGNRMHTHGGNESQQYSGVWMTVEEIPDSHNVVMERIFNHREANNSAWADFTDWSDSFETRTGKMCFNMAGSFYGTAHGGCKLVDNRGNQWGDQGTYGMDWMIITTNVWNKRGLLRVLTVTEGAAQYKLQCRPQGNNQIRNHSGNESQNYAGTWFTLEEC